MDVLRKNIYSIVPVFCHSVISHFSVSCIHRVDILTWLLDTVAHKLVELGLIAQLLLGGVIMLTACRYHSHIYFT